MFFFVISYAIQASFCFFDCICIRTGFLEFDGSKALDLVFIRFCDLDAVFGRHRCSLFSTDRKGKLVVIGPLSTVQYFLYFYFAFTFSFVLISKLFCLDQVASFFSNQLSSAVINDLDGYRVFRFIIGNATTIPFCLFYSICVCTRFIEFDGSETFNVILICICDFNAVFGRHRCSFFGTDRKGEFVIVSPLSAIEYLLYFYFTLTFGFIRIGNGQARIASVVCDSGNSQSAVFFPNCYMCCVPARIISDTRYFIFRFHFLNIVCVSTFLFKCNIIKYCGRVGLCRNRCCILRYRLAFKSRC